MSIESKDSINSRFTHSTVSTIEQIMRSRNPNYDLDASASERQHSDPVKVVRKAALYGSLIALLICGFILAIASLVMPWSGLVCMVYEVLKLKTVLFCQLQVLPH